MVLAEAKGSLNQYCVENGKGMREFAGFCEGIPRLLSRIVDTSEVDYIKLF